MFRRQTSSAMCANIKSGTDIVRCGLLLIFTGARENRTVAPKYNTVSSETIIHKVRSGLYAVRTAVLLKSVLYIRTSGSLVFAEKLQNCRLWRR